MLWAKNTDRLLWTSGKCTFFLVNTRTRTHTTRNAWITVIRALSCSCARRLGFGLANGKGCSVRRARASDVHVGSKLDPGRVLNSPKRQLRGINVCKRTSGLTPGTFYSRCEVHRASQLFPSSSTPSSLVITSPSLCPSPSPFPSSPPFSDAPDMTTLKDNWYIRNPTYNHNYVLQPRA